MASGFQLSVHPKSSGIVAFVVEINKKTIF